MERFNPACQPMNFRAMPIATTAGIPALCHVAVVILDPP
jgi:hypothetical protein